MDLRQQMDIVSEDRAKRDNITRQSRIRNLLRAKIATCIQTFFIGAISTLENRFGHLWGHGLPESELTDEQWDFRYIWEKCRTELLNKGNDQKRKAEHELEKYIVDWKEQNEQSKVFNRPYSNRRQTTAGPESVLPVRCSKK